MVITFCKSKLKASVTHEKKKINFEWVKKKQW